MTLPAGHILGKADKNKGETGKRENGEKERPGGSITLLSYFAFFSFRLFLLADLQECIFVALTPLMEQYLAVKRQYADAVVLFRLGDFYEVFFEDASQVSALLDLTLTARDGGDGKVPMCGVPHHAVQGYLARLIKAGKKVAICEQVEDPKLAKGLVKREVVRVVTPSTFIENDD